MCGRCTLCPKPVGHCAPPKVADSRPAANAPVLPLAGLLAQAAAKPSKPAKPSGQDRG